ncbi:MAG: nitroreductase family protein, partial [Candidatus Pacebacteria bacterium]|nr:nitroreductase family protein [Candidatus Paceibacterota bacterium]
EFVHTANGIICITSVFDRSTRKYGSVGYKLILLEAGHVGQNICIAGVEKDVSFCGLGRSNNILIENEIGINSLNESVVYTMAF